jgi:hypothetical protein
LVNISGLCPDKPKEDAKKEAKNHGCEPGQEWGSTGMNIVTPKMTA